MGDLLSSKQTTSAKTTNQQIGVQGGAGNGDNVGVAAGATYVGRGAVSLSNKGGNVTIQTDMGAVGAALDTVNHVSMQAINYANENLNTALQSLTQLQTNADNLVSSLQGGGIIATTNSAQTPATGGVGLDYNKLVLYGGVLIVGLVAVAIYFKNK